MPDLPVVGDAPSHAVHGAEEKGKSLKEALTKKYGPAPLWVYLAVGTVAGWFLFFRGKSGSASGSGSGALDSALMGGGAGGGPPVGTTGDPLSAVFSPIQPAPAANLTGTVWPGTAASTSDPHANEPAPMTDTSPYLAPSINAPSVAEAGGAIYTDPASTSVAPFEGTGVSTVGGVGIYGQRLVDSHNLPVEALPTTQLVGGVPISLSSEAAARGGIAAKDIPQQPNTVGPATRIATEPAVSIA